ncbi:hypothetical protein MBLNU457_4428t1 [Dothideomycetes sp. NU457]
MPTTRAMARKAPTISEENDEEEVLSLRKKPIRRATRKVAANAASDKPSKKQTHTNQPAQPLSPKKIAQITKATPDPGTKPTHKIDDNKENGTSGSLPQLAAREMPNRSKLGRPATRLTSKPRAAPLGAQKVQTRQDPKHEPTSSRQHKNNPDLLSCDAVAEIKHNGNCVQNASPDTGSIQKPSLPEVPSTSTTGTPAHSPQSTRRRSNIARHSLGITTLKPASVPESEDELCGAKTPLTRRETAHQFVEPTHSSDESDDESVVLTSQRSFKTPSRRPVASRPPHTQKVPIKPPGSASPKRPMSVNRGSSIAYVFHPLPKPQRTKSQPGRVSSPIKFPYQWPVLPTDDAEKVIEDHAGDDAPTSPRPSPHRAKTIDPAQLSTGTRRRRHRHQHHDHGHRVPFAGRRLNELFQSDFDSDDDEEDSDSDDETAATEAENDDTAADEPTFSSATAPHDDYPAMVPTLTIDSEESDDEDHEESIVQPELNHSLLLSSPDQTTPLAHHISLDRSQHSPLSDATSSKPTLVSSQFADDDADDDLELSFNIAAQTTPKAAQAAFSPETSALETPHMRSALEGFERRSSVRDMVMPPEKTVCIDPALLSQSEPIFGFAPAQSPPKTSAHAPLLAAEADQILPTLRKSPSKSSLDQNPRLSFFINTEDLCDDGIEHNRAERKSNLVAGLELTDTEAVNAEGNENDAHLDDNNLPHYAMSTVASDARRQSMPSNTPRTPHTPHTLSFRPRTADTCVKAGTHDSFAKLWLERQTGASGKRRSTLGMPQRTPKADFTSTPLARSSSKISLHGKASSQNLRHSVDDTPSTVAATPRPRCYTPTFRFARPATPSRSPVRSPARSPVRSPVKMPAKSPAKSTCCSPAKRTSPVKVSSRTPMKTPLKSAGATPAAVMFTPHPKQPLRSVVALVEVFTLDGSDASRSFVASLQRLGAKTTKTWSDRVTHVVFKEGSPGTLQKVRLANKAFTEGGFGKEIFCVNSRWVTDCDRLGSRMDEHAEHYAVDVLEIPRGGKKRRKSMEPAVLHNLDGNIVPTPGGTAKKTPGRATDSRLSLASTIWGESPIKGGYTPTASGTPDFNDEEDSWLQTPGQQASEDDHHRLQQTMPVNKVRKFKLPELENVERRRLTAWEMQD